MTRTLAAADACARQRRRPAATTRRALWAVAAAWPLVPGAAWAAAEAQAAATQAVPASGAAPASAPASAPAADYVDKLMVGAPPLPELVDDGSAGFDASGAPRSLRIESRAQSSSNDLGHEASAWVNLRGTMDTANYGAFSLDASTRLFETGTVQRRGAGVSFSLYQSAMPFGGGWYASQGLGVIQTLSPRLAWQQASFFVPTRLVQGASTQWRNDGAGLTVQLSGGQTGSFSSIGQGSFYGSGDRVAALGFELQAARTGGPSLLPSGWTYSAMASSATGSVYSGTGQAVPGFLAGYAEPAGSAVLQSLRWESIGTGSFVQGNLIAGRNQDPVLLAQGVAGVAQASRAGAWFDGATQSGEITQRWGLHHLAPGLSWQGYALGGNSEGGYYRWSQLGLATQVEAQVSSAQPVDLGAGGATLHQAGVSVRHYIDRQLGVGGVVQVSGGTTTAWQLSGYSELHRAWADLRVQAGFETSGGRIVVRRLAADQAWTLPIGQRLSTSQALTSSRAGAQDASGAALGDYGTALDLAVAAGADVGERISLDLNARASLPLSTQAARIYNISASSQWRFARAWSVSAALGLSHTTGLTGPITVSPIPGLPGTFTAYQYPGTSSRDLWVTLRYDFQAGSASVPIGAGARVGAGGGTIDGVVYLDDNRNGRLDALEARAVNVTVMLDGRYATRTDAQGRFEFPFVAPGAHAVTVLSDTLPLPWTMPAAAVQRVEVVPRESTRIEIGAQRERAGPNE